MRLFIDFIDWILPQTSSGCLANGVLAGVIGGICMFIGTQMPQAPMIDNQAELKPLDEDEFEHLKISVLVEKLKAQIDRLERRRDAGQEAVGEGYGKNN